MALILIESTVATRGETSTSYGTRCCTKARAEALNCTVSSPSGAASNQLITGIKGNLPNLRVTMAGWTYSGTATSPSVSGNTGGGTVTYTYKASGASSYSSTKPTNAGTHTVKASVAATTDYIAKEVTSTYTVAKANASIKFSSTTGSVSAGSTITRTASITTGTGTITYSSSNTSVATVSSSGVITGVTAGDCVITATLPASANYKEATATCTIRVGSVITINNKSTSYAIHSLYKAYYNGAYHEDSQWGANAGYTATIRVGTTGSWTIYFSSAGTVLQSSGSQSNASITSSITGTGNKTFNATCSSTSITISSS